MTELVLSTLPTPTYFTEVDGPTDSEVAVGTKPYPNKATKSSVLPFGHIV